MGPMLTKSRIGMRARVIVSDGLRTNVATMKLLGCDFGEGRFSFTHAFRDEPQQVYCMLDQVHMMKVLRNCFGDLGVITGPFGEARWEHIKQLVNLQVQLY